MDEQAIVERIKQLKRLDLTVGHQHESHAQLYSGGLGILSDLYGTDSPVVRDFREQYRLPKDNNGPTVFRRCQGIIGALVNVEAELKSGLAGKLRARIQGEIIAELLVMAERELDSRRQSGKDIAAVLTAAAFEDAIRRLGESHCGLFRPTELADVIPALRKGNVLASNDAVQGQSLLKFRNDAMHADWAHVTPESVRTAIAFVRGLLDKHFS